MAPSAIVALCLLALASAAPQKHHPGLQCATSCHTKRHANVGAVGKTYSFDYNVMSSVKLVGVNEGITQGGFTGTVDVSRINPCEVAIKFTSSNEAVKVSKHPVVVSINGGGQFEKVCTHPEDDAESVNIKKGIASVIQYSLPSFTPIKRHIVSERSVLGTCPTAYAITNNGDNWVVNKEIVHSECQDHFYSHSEIPSILSKSPMPLQVSKSVCTQVFSASKVPQTITCKDTKVVRPAYGAYKYLEATQESTLQFTSESTDMSVLNSIKGTHLLSKKLSYDHSMPAKNPALVAKLDTVLSNACKMVQGQGHQETASIVNQAFELLKHIPDDAFLAVLSKIRAGEYCADYAKLEALYMDAIAFIGEPGALKVIAQEVSAGRVTGGRTALYTAALHLLSKPTVKHVEALIPIAAMKNPSSTFILAVASVINKHCKVTVCERCPVVKNILNILTDKLVDQCTPSFSISNPITVITTLKTLGNIGYLDSEHAEKVIRCATTEGVETNIRFAATMVLKGIPCKTPVKSTLQAIALDQGMNTEVRIGSYLAAIKCADEGDLQKIIAKVTVESNKQVHSFILTHLNNLKETNWPLKAHLQKMLQNMDIPTNYESNIFKYSRNIEMSYNTPILGIGAAVDSNVVFTPESYIPRLVNLGLDMNLLGSFVNIGEVGARVEGFDPIIKEVFGSESYLYKTPLSEMFKDTPMFIKQNGASIFEKLEKLIRENKSVDIKSLIQSVSKFLKAYNIKLPKMDLYAKLMGQEYAFLSLAGPMQEVNINNVIETITSAVVDALVAAKDFNVNTVRAAHVHVDYAIPTIQGIPLKIKLDSTAVTGIQVQSKLYSKSKAHDALVKFIPSLSIAIDGFIGYGAIMKHGLKMKNAIYSTNGLALFVSLKNGQDLEFKLELPEKMELINIKSEFYQVTINNLMDEKMIYPSNIKDARIATEYCSTIAEAVTGLHICFNINIPDVLNSNSLPLGMPSHFNMFLKKTDADMKGYRVIATFKNKETKKVLQMIAGTYGSASSTEPSVTLTYAKKANSYQTNAEIKSMWFTAACKFNVKKEATENGNQYQVAGFAGLTETLTETHKFLSVKMLHAKIGDVTNADLIVKVETSLLPLTIGFGMDIPSKAPWFAVIRKIELKVTIDETAIEGLVLRKIPGQYQNTFIIQHGGFNVIWLQATHTVSGNVFTKFNHITEASAKLANKEIGTTFSFKHENAAIDTIWELRNAGAKVFNINVNHSMKSNLYTTTLEFGLPTLLKTVKLRNVFNVVEFLSYKIMTDVHMDKTALFHIEGPVSLQFSKTMIKYNIDLNISGAFGGKIKYMNAALLSLEKIQYTLDMRHSATPITMIDIIIDRTNAAKTTARAIIHIPLLVKAEYGAAVSSGLIHTTSSAFILPMDNTAVLHIEGPVSLQFSNTMIKHNIDIKISGAFDGTIKVMNAALLSLEKIQYTLDMRHSSAPITMIDIIIDRTNAAETTAKTIIHIPVLVKAKYGAVVTSDLLHTTMNTFILPTTSWARRFKGYADFNLVDWKMKTDFYWDAEKDTTKKISLLTALKTDSSLGRIKLQGELAVITLIYGFKLEAMMASPFKWFLGTSGMELTLKAPSNKFIVAKALCTVEHAESLVIFKPLVAVHTLNEHKYEIVGSLAIKKLPAIWNFDINSEFTINIPQIQKITVATQFLHEYRNEGVLSNKIMTNVHMGKTALLHVDCPVSLHFSKTMIKHNIDINISGAFIGESKVMNAALLSLDKIQYTFDMRHSDTPITMIDIIIDMTNTVKATTKAIVHVPMLVKAEYDAVVTTGLLHTTMNTFILPTTSLARRFKGYADINLEDQKVKTEFSWDAEKDPSKKIALVTEFNIDSSLGKVWVQGDLSVTTLIYGFKLEAMMASPFEWFLGTSGLEFALTAPSNKVIVAKALCTVEHAESLVIFKPLLAVHTLHGDKYEVAGSFAIKKLPAILNFDINSEITINIPQIQKITVATNFIHEDKNGACATVFKTGIAGLNEPIALVISYGASKDNYATLFKIQHGSTVGSVVTNVAFTSGFKAFDITVDASLPFAIVKALSIRATKTAEGKVTWIYSKNQMVLAKLHYLMTSWTAHTLSLECPSRTIEFFVSLSGNKLTMKVFPEKHLSSKMFKTLVRLTNKVGSAHIECFVTAPSMPNEMRIAAEFSLADPTYDKMVNVDIHFPTSEFKSLVNVILVELNKLYEDLVKDGLIPDVNVVYKELKLALRDLPKHLNTVIRHISKIVTRHWNIVKNWALEMWKNSVEHVIALMKAAHAEVVRYWKILKIKVPIIFNNILTFMKKTEIWKMLNGMVNQIIEQYPAQYNVLLDFYNKVIFTTITEIQELANKIMNLPAFRLETLWNLLKSELPKSFGTLRLQLLNTKLMAITIPKYLNTLEMEFSKILTSVKSWAIRTWNACNCSMVLGPLKVAHTGVLQVARLFNNCLEVMKKTDLWKMGYEIVNQIIKRYPFQHKILHDFYKTIILTTVSEIQELSNIIKDLPASCECEVCKCNHTIKTLKFIKNWTMRMWKIYEAQVIVLMKDAHIEVLHDWEILKTNVPILYNDFLATMKNTEIWKMLYGVLYQIIERYPVQYNILLDIYNKVILTTVTEIKEFTNKIMDRPSFRFEPTWILLKNELPTSFANLRKQILSTNLMNIIIKKFTDMRVQFPVVNAAMVESWDRVVKPVYTDLVPIIWKLMNMHITNMLQLIDHLWKEMPVFINVQYNILLDFNNKVILTTATEIIKITNKIMDLPSFRFEPLWNLLKNELPTILANQRTELLNTKLMTMIIKKLNDMEVQYPTIRAAMVEIWARGIKPLYTDLVNISWKLMNINFTNISQMIDHLLIEIPAIFNKMLNLDTDVVHRCIALCNEMLKHLMDTNVLHMCIELCNKMLVVINVQHKILLDFYNKVILTTVADSKVVISQIMDLPSFRFEPLWKLLKNQLPTIFTNLRHQLLNTKLMTIIIKTFTDMRVQFPTVHSAMIDIWARVIKPVYTDLVNIFWKLMNSNLTNISQMIDHLLNEIPALFNKMLNLDTDAVRMCIALCNKMLKHLMDNDVLHMCIAFCDKMLKHFMDTDFVHMSITIVTDFIEANPMIKSLHEAVIEVCHNILMALWGDLAMFYEKLRINKIVDLVQHIINMKEFSFKFVATTVHRFVTEVLGVTYTIAGDHISAVVILPVSVSTIRPIWNTVTVHLPAFVAEMMNSFAAVIKHIPVWVTTMREQVFVFVKFVADQIPVIVRIVETQVPKLINELITVLNNFIEFLTNTEVAKFLMDKIEEVIKMYPVIKEKVTVFVAEQIQVIVRSVETYVPKFISELVPVLNQLINNIQFDVKKFISEWDTVLNNLIKNIPVFVKKMQERVIVFVKFVADQIPVIIRTVETHFPKSINELVVVLNNFIEHIPVLVTKMKEQVTVFVKFVADQILVIIRIIETHVPKLINELVVVLKHIIKNIPVWIRTIKEQVTGSVKFIADKIPVIVKSIETHVPKLINELVAVFKNVIKNIPVWVTTMRKQVIVFINVVADHIPVIVRAVETHVPKFINALVTVLNNFIKNIPVLNNFIEFLKNTEVVKFLMATIEEVLRMYPAIKEQVTVFVKFVAGQILVIVRIVETHLPKLINELVTVLNNWIEFLMNTEIVKFLMANIEEVVRMYPVMKEKLTVIMKLVADQISVIAKFLMTIIEEVIRMFPAYFNAIKEYFEWFCKFANEYINLAFTKMMEVPIIRRFVEYIWNLIYHKDILTSMLTSWNSASSSVTTYSLTVLNNVPSFIKLHTPTVASFWMSYLIQ